MTYDDQGKVVESWDIVDQAGLFNRLGFLVLPPAPGGAEDPE